MEALMMIDTNPFRGFLTTTVAALFVATSTHAAFINISGENTVESDASVDATSSPFSAFDDPGDILFFDQVDSEVSTVFSSGSSYAGQSITQTTPDFITGSGSAMGDAIAFFPEGSAAESISDFVYVFEVDAPTKLELDWVLRANGVGDDTEFSLRWLLQVNGGDIGSTIIASTDSPATWSQASIAPESFQLTPGNSYTFSIGASGHTEAGADALSNDFFGSYGAQWQFTLSIPAPSTIAAFAPMSLLATRRRR